MPTRKVDAWRLAKLPRAVVVLLMWVVLATVAGGALAQPTESTPPATSTAADRAEAERLFDEGRRLMMEPGQLDLACETFVKSLDLMVRGDTYLNLAECHRRQGKTATAWREFGAALEHAESVRFAEAIETAKKIRIDLGNNLSYLTVQVPQATARLEQLVIKLNGEDFPKDQWGKPMALDPTTYTVEATAKGQQPLKASVELAAESDKKEIVVVLKAVPPPPPPPPPPPAPEPAPEPPSEGVHPLAIVGFVVGGVGLAAFAVAGGISLDKRSGFDDSCPNDLCPPGSDQADIDEAILVGRIATAGLIVGAVGVAAGVVGLFLDPPGSSEGDARLQLDLGPGSATLRGSF